MVRLKVLMLWVTLRKMAISIPYGSIKRNLLRTIKFFGLVFQFHMVRLKASFVGDGADACVGFQFHMVRLKVLIVLTFI